MRHASTLLAIGLATLAGCQEAKSTLDSAANRASEAAAEAASIASQKFMAARDQFQTVFDTELKEWDKKYQELKEKAKTATGEAKARLDAQLKNFDEQKAKLAVLKDKVKDASMENWEVLKKDLTTAMEELKKTLQ